MSAVRRRGETMICGTILTPKITGLPQRLWSGILGALNFLLTEYSSGVSGGGKIQKVVHLSECVIQSSSFEAKVWTNHVFMPLWNLNQSWPSWPCYDIHFKTRIGPLNGQRACLLGSRSLISPPKNAFVFLLAPQESDFSPQETSRRPRATATGERAATFFLPTLP